MSVLTHYTISPFRDLGSVYFHLIKYTDSDHLCYVYLASYPSPADLSTEGQYLVLWVLPFKLVQKTCTK